MKKTVLCATSLVVAASLIGGFNSTGALWSQDNQVTLGAVKEATVDREELLQLAGQDKGFAIQIGDETGGRDNNGYSDMPAIVYRPHVVVPPDTTYTSPTGLLFAYVDASRNKTPWGYMNANLEGYWWLQPETERQCSVTGRATTTFNNIEYYFNNLFPGGRTKEIVKYRYCFTVTNYSSSNEELEILVSARML